MIWSVGDFLPKSRSLWIPEFDSLAKEIKMNVCLATLGSMSCIRHFQEKATSFICSQNIIFSQKSAMGSVLFYASSDRWSFTICTSVLVKKGRNLNGTINLGYWAMGDRTDSLRKKKGKGRKPGRKQLWKKEPKHLTFIIAIS